MHLFPAWVNSFFASFFSHACSTRKKREIAASVQPAAATSFASPPTAALPQHPHRAQHRCPHHRHHHRSTPRSPPTGSTIATSRVAGRSNSSGRSQLAVAAAHLRPYHLLLRLSTVPAPSLPVAAPRPCLHLRRASVPTLHCAGCSTMAHWLQLPPSPVAAPSVVVVASPPPAPSILSILICSSSIAGGGPSISIYRSLHPRLPVAASPGGGPNIPSASRCIPDCQSQHAAMPSQHTEALVAAHRAAGPSMR